MRRLLSLVGFAIVFLSQQQIIETVNPTIFHCESPEDIKQIREADVKRFFIFGDTLHLVFNDKVILFPLPNLTETEPSLITYQAYYVAVREENEEWPVIGYSYVYMYFNSPIKTLVEHYLDEKNNRILRRASMIDFSKVPGKRVSKYAPQRSLDVTDARILFNDLWSDPGLPFENNETRHKRDLIEYPPTGKGDNFFNFKVNNQSFFHSLAESTFVLTIVSQQKNANETEEHEMCFQTCLRQKGAPSECLKTPCFPTVGKRKIKFFGAYLQGSDPEQSNLSIYSLDSNGNLMVESKKLLFTEESLRALLRRSLIGNLLTGSPN